MGMSIGWSEISEDDVRSVANAMKSAGEGVVDEVGVRVLHGLYADRFFPGVSVQQRRLRYVFIVPWVYQWVAEQPARARDPRRYIREAEVEVAKWLNAGGDTLGLVGSSQLGKPVKLPPSTTYHGLLGQMGILPFNRRQERPCSLDEIVSTWPGTTRKLKPDADGAQVGERRLLPDAGVALPSDFLEGKGVFVLSADEREQAARRLRGILRFGEMGNAQSLLATLVAHAPNLDPRALFALGGVDERKIAEDLRLESPGVIERAAKAASLGAVVKATYAALVEREYELDTKRGAETGYREGLANLVETHGAFARDLDLDAVRHDGHPRSGSARALTPGHYIRTLLDRTLSTLRADTLHTANGLASLLHAYRTAEGERKGDKARLRSAASALREAWLHGASADVTPLHYRSWVVRQFLLDLGGEAR